MDFLKKLHEKVSAPDGNLELRLDNWSVPLGSSLTGSLVFSAQEDFDCTEVRCEVACVETARVIRYVYDPNVRRSLPHEADETATLYAINPASSGPTHFTRSAQRSFPVNIAIPPASRTTFNGVGQKLVWTIKGVIAVDGRPDVTTNTFEFQVVPPAPVINQPSVQVVKEVVIVKIPCKYCQTLFNQLDTFCPNCGARRTA
ncbi:MAG: hypothetical protein NWE92_02385 [Candidatus Bathyarchaeota archaeon]|nr:hypothetical protein [Candidatus Bathyarchaeota archaeon]